MNTNIIKDIFCDFCSLQFNKKHAFNVHMTLVHKNTSTESPQFKIDKKHVYYYDVNISSPQENRSQYR